MNALSVEDWAELEDGDEVRLAVPTQPVDWHEAADRLQPRPEPVASP